MKTLNSNIDGNKTKWQKKTLINNITQDGEIFSFTNLELGKTYEIESKIHGIIGTAATDSAFVVTLNIDSTEVSQTVFGVDPSLTGNMRADGSMHHIFVYSGGIVNIAATSMESGVGNHTIEGPTNRTWAVIKELPDHVETNQW